METNDVGQGTKEKLTIDLTTNFFYQLSNNSNVYRINTRKPYLKRKFVLMRLIFLCAKLRLDMLEICQFIYLPHV